MNSALVLSDGVNSNCPRADDHIAIGILRGLARAVTGAHIVETVAASIRGVEPAGELVVDEGAVDRRRALVAVEVRGRELGVGAALEIRPLRDHVDDAGRGVLAEHRALRTLQHLDALELAEIAEAHPVARPVDAVDDDTDGRFEADVVADRADSADARGRGNLARRRGDDQPGRQQRQVLDVSHTGIAQQLRPDRGDGDRHVLQILVALLRGDGDRGQQAIIVIRVLFRRLRECAAREDKADDE